MTLRGYYAILDVPLGEAGDRWSEQDHGSAVERATRLLAARPCMLQIRAKGARASDLAALARAVLPAARAAGIPLCVNDRLDVALAIGAEAVHLGQNDLPLAEAREIARGRLLIGISTHGLEQARVAIAGGADYIGFGPIFATMTKTNPDPVVGIAGLREVVTLVARSKVVAAIAIGAPVPVVAIGGITLQHVAEIASAGASGVALIGAVEGAADPTAAGWAVNAAFGQR